MHAAYEAGETSEAHRIAGEQFDPVAGEPKAVMASRDDRLEPSLRRILVPWLAFVHDLCASLGSMRREDKAGRIRRAGIVGLPNLP